MKIKSLLQIGIAMAALSLWALANPVTITFESSGSSSPGGVAYYPYTIQVNNGSGTADWTVACDDFFDHVQVGETYTGWVSSYSDLSHTLFNGGNATPDVQYQELAWLFAQLQATPPVTDPENAALNYAMWDLFSSSAPALDSDGTQVSQGSAVSNGVDSSLYWLNAAATEAAGGFSGFNFSNYYIFSPVNADGSPYTGSDRPQEFIGSTVPEPATLALLGTGLLVLGLAFRRRLSTEGANLQA